VSESTDPNATPDARLAALRAEVDAIDDAMLALAMKRAGMARTLVSAKDASGSILRPAREVQILRRLIAASGDAMEPDAVVAVWRALIGVNLALQRPLEVIAAGAIDPVRQVDLARQHFGPQARISRAADMRAVLSRVAAQTDVAAVLPWPGASGPGSWWASLMESRFQPIQVVAGLPMRAGAPEAALVASGVKLEACGRDRTLIVAQDQHFRLSRALQEAGLTGRELARANIAVLAELDGFVAQEDLRREALARAGLDGVRVVGAFAPL
jgi:chorismate mutase